ncbi:MAG: hypothetical protein ACR2QM_18035, partial [Longimicrobiales bacterium]
MSIIRFRPVFIVGVMALAHVSAEPFAASAQTSDELRLAVVAPQQLDLTVEEALGEVLLVDYSVPGSGTSYRMHVTLRAGEVSWTELRDGGRSETDPAQSVRLDDHR